jgi:MraZ protein
VENLPQVQVSTVEKPHGLFPGKLDDKGRLKLPTNVQEYLRSFGEQKFFITSLDRRLAQIYPMPVWRENEKFFENFTEDPEAADNIAFNAADLGADAEMDAQGRLTLNTRLRRELDLEEQDLHLHAFNGRIEIMSEAVYQERRRAAQQKPAADLTILKKQGLK